MPRPIRILLIAPSLRILGGQAVQGQRLLRNLQREPGIEVEFLPMNPRLPGPLAILERIKYVRTLSNLIAFCALLLLKAVRCDVIHVFAASYYSFLWSPAPALIVAKLFGKKSVLNYRDGQAEGHLRDWKSAVPLVRLADVVVTPSGYLVEVFAKFGIEARLITNVIETDHLIRRPRRELRPHLLHNRILEPLYNVPCALRAFQRVQQRYPKASMTVAHDGPLRASLEQLAAELQLRNVTFVGRVSQEMIREVYDAADIYWTCPNFDCMPGSLLECFASGLPVIATRAGGIPFILDHERTALMFEPDDDDAMAEAAFRLLEDPDLVERLTANAYAELEKYRWGAIGSQWLAVYEELHG